MKLEIISPEQTLFEGESEYISFPGIAGSFDVLPHHAALITALREGTIRFITDGHAQELKIKSGFIEIKEEIVSVCVE